MPASIRTNELGSRQPIAWVGLLFFSVCATCAWWAAEGRAAIVLGVFAVLSVTMLRGRAAITLDPVGITRHTRFFTHRIEWHEIDRVETDGVTLVLSGARKRLPVAPPFWDRATAAAARARLELELTIRGVPRVQNPVASRLTACNTRIRPSRA
jgi:hypothetical protein